mmetsp:Transcript_57234/g.139554  ORF Transcript_57234/g.139554 Transcript_57234/m.139554 type:complete len:334 (-) Transcript_57234:723-1724(-)
MVDVSLSTIAWISVVLIQAIVHWMMFGGGSKMKIKNQHDQQQHGDQKQAATSAAAALTPTSSSSSSSPPSCAETDELTTQQGEGNDENDNDDSINPTNLFLAQRRPRQLFDVDTDDDDDDDDDNDQDFYGERRVDDDDDDNVQAQSTQATADVPPQAQSRSRSTTPGRRRLSSSSPSSPPTMTMMAPLTPSPTATPKKMKSLSSSSSSPFLQDYGHDQLYSSLNHRREGRSWPSSFSSSSLSPTISSRTMLKLGGGMSYDPYTKSTNTDADIVTLATRASSVLSIRDVSAMLEDDQEDEEEFSPLELSQTGSELFKNRSVDNMVEEQIRAVPQ